MVTESFRYMQEIYKSCALKISNLLPLLLNSTNNIFSTGDFISYLTIFKSVKKNPGYAFTDAVLINILDMEGGNAVQNLDMTYR